MPLTRTVMLDNCAPPPKAAIRSLKQRFGLTKNTAAGRFARLRPAARRP
jgi:hypothetical protein